MSLESDMNCIPMRKFDSGRLAGGGAGGGRVGKCAGGGCFFVGGPVPVTFFGFAAPLVLPAPREKLPVLLRRPMVSAAGSEGLVPPRMDE